MRHRFLLGNQQLCRESFGGMAQCLLPLENESMHYADDQHPYQGDGNRECSWALQAVGAQAITCGADREDQVHQIPEPPLWDSREPVTVHMEYPVEEMPTRVMADRPMPTYGGDSPEGVGILDTEQRAALEREADAYRWKLKQGAAPPENPWDGNLHDDEQQPGDEAMARLEAAVQNLPDVNSGDPQPEWSKACEYLESEDIGLLYGPWPVRKFALDDMPQAMGQDQYPAYWECLGALGTLGMDYDLSVWRPDGMPWRFAVVTWGSMLGLSIPAVCDELAVQYGS
jgi:hypothetical protein